MATLEIRKETNKVWRHVPSDALPYIVSKLYIKSDGDFIRVVEQGGSQRGQYNFADVSVYNIGGVAETFGSAQQLMERLEALNYIGFFYEGEVSPSELISSDVDNAIELGTDGKLFAPISGGAVDSVNGQTGVVVLDSNDIPQVYQTISTNTTLDNTYHSATVWVTATCNVTIPSGLRSDFYCNIRTFAGATATYLTSGTVINTESDGDVQAPSTMINISTFSTNNFILSGGGLS